MTKLKGINRKELEKSIQKGFNKYNLMYRENKHAGWPRNKIIADEIIKNKSSILEVVNDA